MRIDGGSIPNNVEIVADVIVVGAGPAGITIAEILSAGGLHAILLESGLSKPSARANDALRGQSIGEPFPLVASRQRAFAGTGSHWTSKTGLRVRPMDPIDFESRRGLRPGWPFGIAELERHFDWVHADLGLSGDYRPERWFHPDDVPPLAWDGGPELAMFQFADHRTYVNRRSSVTSHPRIDLVVDATVREIIVDAETGQVSLLRIVSSKGVCFFARAREYVLACGGIDNARLLLASPGRSGGGVGNEYDNVGRYLMEHLSIDSGVIRRQGATRLDVSGFEERHDNDGVKHSPMLWVGEDRLRAEGLLNAGFWVTRVDARFNLAAVQSARAIRAAHAADAVPAHLGKHLRNVVRGAPGLARFAVARMQADARGRTSVAFRVMAEQTPLRESRITLSDRCDRVGMPRVCVDWRVASADREMIRRHQELLADMFAARGIGTLTNLLGDEDPPATLVANYHHMGTTRMHPDPRYGVVDADCSVHGVPNLSIAGSSVFPSGGYVNPTLTLLALAARLAERLKESLLPTALPGTSLQGSCRYKRQADPQSIGASPSAHRIPE